MLPWIAAALIGLMALGLGIGVDDDACWHELRFGALPEGSSGSGGGFLVYETCTADLPGGRAREAAVVHWYALAIALSSAAGAWFAVAGLTRRVSLGRASIAVIASAAVFLAASAIFFV